MNQWNDFCLENSMMLALCWFENKRRGDLSLEKEKSSLYMCS